MPRIEISFLLLFCLTVSYYVALAVLSTGVKGDPLITEPSSEDSLTMDARSRNKRCSGVYGMQYPIGPVKVIQISPQEFKYGKMAHKLAEAGRLQV